MNKRLIIVSFIAATLQLQCSAISIIQAQKATSLLIAPTTWAAYAAKANSTNPKIINGALIIADLTRLINDILIYNIDNDVFDNPSRHRMHIHAGSYYWLASTASLNLYSLAEHLHDFVHNQIDSYDQFDDIGDIKDVDPELVKEWTNKIIFRKALLPLLESISSFFVNIDRVDLEGAAKLYKAIAQHLNQFIDCSPEKDLKKTACMVAMVIDFYAFWKKMPSNSDGNDHARMLNILLPVPPITA